MLIMNRQYSKVHTFEVVEILQIITSSDMYLGLDNVPRGISFKDVERISKTETESRNFAEKTYETHMGTYLYISGCLTLY